MILELPTYVAVNIVDIHLLFYPSYFIWLEEFLKKKKLKMKYFL